MLNLIGLVICLISFKVSAETGQEGWKIIAMIGIICNIISLIL
jgi:hypothetical protein